MNYVDILVPVGREGWGGDCVNLGIRKGR
jgi:hypothetical protein